MSDLLAIFEDPGNDSRLLAEISAQRPDHVCLLLAGGGPELLLEDSPEGARTRERLALLLAAVERDTGAVVVGLAGDRAQLGGRRFARELGAAMPLAA